MTNHPREIKERVSELFEKRAKRFKRASFFVKIFLIASGAAVAGIAQFADVAPDQEFSVAKIVGIAASLIAFVGAIFDLITNEDASEELIAARLAADEVSEIREFLGQSEIYEEIIEQQLSLYQSVISMRGAIERGAVSRESSEIVIKTMLTLSSRSLPVALAFSQADCWTVCVYQAEPRADGGRDVLRCIAHTRAIPCEISQARVWEEGVGVSGIAYATRQEIIVPDMRAAGLGSVFNVASDTRDYDSDRYRSMAVVPVKVDGQLRPWGVVVATNDRENHFLLEEGGGLQSAEAVRALAGMVALAVAVSGPAIPSA
jgi:GAF domain-containing protein